MRNKVIVPDHWYKILVWCKNGELQAEYIFADHKTNTKLVSYNSEYCTLILVVYCICYGTIYNRWPVLKPAGLFQSRLAVLKPASNLTARYTD